MPSYNHLLSEELWTAQNKELIGLQHLLKQLRGKIILYEPNKKQAHSAPTPTFVRTVNLTERAVIVVQPPVRCGDRQQWRNFNHVGIGSTDSDARQIAGDQRTQPRRRAERPLAVETWTRPGRRRRRRRRNFVVAMVGEWVSTRQRRCRQDPGESVQWKSRLRGDPMLGEAGRRQLHPCAEECYAWCAQAQRPRQVDRQSKAQSGFTSLNFFLHKSFSKRWFRHWINSLLKRADARASADIINRIWRISLPEHVSWAENGAELAENRLERSGAVSVVQKIKWSVSGSGRSSERKRSGEREKICRSKSAPP